MAKEIRNTIRLGVFVVAGIGMFTTAFYLIGNEKNLFGSRFRISTLVNNASGLQVGNNVRYAGIVVGSVEDIHIINDSTLQIDMVLEGKVRQFIKKDAVASVGMDGLVGNVIVNISPGSGNMPPVEDHEIIAAATRLDANVMMEKLGLTNDNVALLSQQLLAVSQKLNEGEGTIPRLIRDSLMAVDFAYSIHNLRVASENIMRLTAQMQQQIDQISKGGGTLGYLLHDQTLPHQLENMTSRLDSLYVGKTEPIIENLRKSTEDIAAASAELKLMLEALENGDGLANTILRDTAAAQDLKAILVNINAGTAGFTENMEALKHNFLFRRYFKKQAKGQPKD
ncbi:MAG: MlaD family protein [Bacteroidota bacterium]